jgi:hypothetical protein
VAVNNAVFWDIKAQLLPHRRYIPSPLHRPAGKWNVRFEVFTAVNMKNAVFWDIENQLISHKKHITSMLQSQAG